MKPPSGPGRPPSFEAAIGWVYDGAWCTLRDNGDCSIDHVSVDQWWKTYIRCVHGKYAGISNGMMDPGNALVRAIDVANEAHKLLPKEN